MSKTVLLLSIREFNVKPERFFYYLIAFPILILKHVFLAAKPVKISLAIPTKVSLIMRFDDYKRKVDPAFFAAI